MEHVEIVVEVAAGSRVKRASDGRLDFVSPFPCPFNYGSVPDRRAADGEPADALILGPPLPRGSRGRWRVWGVVRFLDGGLPDDKLICGDEAPSPGALASIDLFFRWYARAKRVVGRRTRYLGLEPRWS